MFTARGGGNADEAVKLMLKFLMTDDLQDGHCYRGQSEKTGFCNYSAILQCILGKCILFDILFNTFFNMHYLIVQYNVLHFYLDALKENVHTRGNATMMVLDTAMSKALKQASDRVNQRK